MNEKVFLANDVFSGSAGFIMIMGISLSRWPVRYYCFDGEKRRIIPPGSSAQ